MPDHVAFRASDADAVRSMRWMLTDHGPTEGHDRKDVLLPYVRDPADILMEDATDGPGMTVDEAADDRSRTLVLSPQEPGRAADLNPMWPQFALPGGARMPARDDPLTRDASTLARDLGARDAKVEVPTVAADHAPSGADVTEAARWLRQNLPGAMPDPTL